MIILFALKKNLKNAHCKILVSVTSEEKIVAECNSAKELCTNRFVVSRCKRLERNSSLGVMYITYDLVVGNGLKGLFSPTH
jgi:hypothetical protein